MMTRVSHKVCHHAMHCCEHTGYACCEFQGGAVGVGVRWGLTSLTSVWLGMPLRSGLAELLVERTEVGGTVVCIG
jgi:hypothetical protein